jgi:hypothetical protein
MGSNPTVPHDARYHYGECQRLLAVVPETPETALRLAVVHALLTLAPRRAWRQRQPSDPAVPPNLRWPDADD